LKSIWLKLRTFKTF